MSNQNNDWRIESPSQTSEREAAELEERIQKREAFLTHHGIKEQTSC